MTLTHTHYILHKKQRKTEDVLVENRKHQVITQKSTKLTIDCVIYNDLCLFCGCF